VYGRDERRYGFRGITSLSSFPMVPFYEKAEADISNMYILSSTLLDHPDSLCAFTQGLNSGVAE